MQYVVFFGNDRNSVSLFEFLDVSNAFPRKNDLLFKQKECPDKVQGGTARVQRPVNAVVVDTIVMPRHETGNRFNVMMMTTMIRIRIRSIARR